MENLIIHQEKFLIDANSIEQFSSIWDEVREGKEIKKKGKIIFPTLVVCCLSLHHSLMPFQAFCFCEFFLLLREDFKIENELNKNRK